MYVRMAPRLIWVGLVQGVTLFSLYDSLDRLLQTPFYPADIENGDMYSKNMLLQVFLYLSACAFVPLFV